MTGKAVPALLITGALTLIAWAGLAAPGQGTPGFHTDAPSYLTLAEDVEGSVRPIITTNDELSNGFRFPGIPDGLGMTRAGRGAVDLFVSHEYDPSRAPFVDAQVSRLRLSTHDAGVLAGEAVVPDGLGYARFCSGSLSEGFGFLHPIYLANEEVDDGIVVAVEADTGTIHELPWLGMFSHENTILVEHFQQDGRIVALTTEDGDATESEVYLYVADDAAAFLEGEGQLYVLGAQDPATFAQWDDLYHADGAIPARFIPLAWDWQTQDESALHAEAIAVGAFRLIRPEDAAADKRPGMGNVVYMADTGNDRDENGVAIPVGANGQSWQRGRIYALAFSASDPLALELSVLLDGNDPAAPGNLMSNPDNVDTSQGSLMIQEDRIGATRTTVTSPYDVARNAQILRYDLATHDLNAVAYLTQVGSPMARHGEWESSGIIDASGAFGAGAWLADVQAGTLGSDGPNGQLLLLRVDGS